MNQLELQLRKDGYKALFGVAGISDLVREESVKVRIHEGGVRVIEIKGSETMYAITYNGIYRLIEEKLAVELMNGRLLIAEYRQQGDAVEVIK